MVMVMYGHIPSPMPGRCWQLLAFMSEEACSIHPTKGLSLF